MLRTVAFTDFASRSLHVKVHPEKKFAIKKNSTVIDKEFDSLSNRAPVREPRTTCRVAIADTGMLIHGGCCRYTKVFCVEPTLGAGPRTLAAGATWVGAQQISVLVPSTVAVIAG